MPDATRRQRVGLLFAALCVANGSVVPAFAKLTTAELDALSVATLTSLFAGALALAHLRLRGELRHLFELRTLPRLVLIGALATAAAFFLFFEGARRSSAVETVICLQIEALYALVLAWLALGQRPTRRRLVSTAALLVGIALAVGARGLSPKSGVWMLLAAPICWQLSHVVVLRGLSSVPPRVLTGARYAWGGLCLAVIWLLRAEPASLPRAAELVPLLPALALQGLVLSYLGTLFWYEAITRIDLARATSIVVPSIPLLSVGASFVLLGEVPTPWQWTGLLLTVGGVLSFATAPDAGRHAPRARRSRGARGAARGLLPRALGRVLRTGGLVLLGLVAADVLYLAWIWPDFDALARGPVPRSSFMESYEEERASHARWPRLSWRPVPLSTISRPALRAVLVGEDAAFYSHGGLDMDEMKAALDATVERGRRLRGASTISQQTARNLFLSPERSWLRKWHELVLTLALEQTLEKRRILELYLNVAEFGLGVYGIEAAARVYFGTSADELSSWQAAELAASLPSPRLHNPATRTRAFERRADRILRRMQRRRDLDGS